MDYYSNQISKLIDELSRLPGIGAKSASRLAFHLIHMPKEEVKRLADTMVEARENVRYCKECCTLTDQELCPICSNLNRDHKTIMVVENTRDLAAYEKTGKYNGVYHVLHGAISPMLGIGPGDIKLKELIRRLEADAGKEAAAVSHHESAGVQRAEGGNGTGDPVRGRAGYPHDLRTGDAGAAPCAGDAL